jgi:TPR repeat protein
MAHSRENKLTRRRFQQYVVLLRGWVLSLCLLPPVGSLAGAPPTKTDPRETAVQESNLAVWMSNKNEGWAAYNLGRAYHTGSHGIKKNAAKAFEYYQVGAEAGYAMAQANFGYCHETGFGTDRNLNDAIKWYRASAEQGNRFGQLNYAGKILENALRLKNENKMLEARDWYLKAHYQDETLTEAAYGIGVTYIQLPTKTRENTRLAKRWFALAAAGNHTYAQFALGYLDEVAGNNKSAFNWYSISMAGGSFPAIFNLARCYEYGIGVAQSSELARKHYRLAAMSGHPESQYSIGLLVYNAANSELDLGEACMWWSLARKNGVPEATEALRKLEGSRLLSHEGITTAKNAAAKFTPKAPPAKHSPTSFNIEIAVSTEPNSSAASGFFVTRDGWLITSIEALSLDHQTLKLKPGYEIKVITEAGEFLVSDSIIVNKNRSIAALKVTGDFHPLPLGDSDNIREEAPMFAVSLDSPSQDNFKPQILKGTVGSTTKGRRNEPLFSINTSEIPASFSNLMVFDALGQATGFVFAPTHPSGTELVATKINAIENFLKDNIPSIKLETKKPLGEPSEIAMMDMARQGTAMVVVYRK